MMLLLLLFALLLTNQSLGTTTTLSPISAIPIPTINILQLQADLLNILQQIPKNDCSDSLMSLILGVSTGENWALRMVDASAKPQSGILMGNIMHVGNYDECLEIKESHVQGKYCTGFGQPHPKYGQDFSKLLNKLMEDFQRNEDEQDIVGKARLSYGFCVPKVCTAKLLQNASSIIEESLQSFIHFTFDDRYCDTTDRKEFTKAAIVAIIIFSIFAAILICGTVYDILVYQKLTDDEKEPNLLVAFSMYTNAQKILSTKTSEGTLSCLNGLRVISMMWIIIAHGFMGIFYFPHINGQELKEWKNREENSFVAASSMAVDTFFVISGLLVVYLFLKSQAKGVRFNIPMFYIHRLLRLTPSLVMVVLLTGTLLNYLGRGPFWPVVDELYQKPCETNWWSTLIYIQNYLNPNEQCAGQAWYLAVDTQMYFLSPLILLPLIRWPKPTLAAIILAVVLNSAYVFEITWKKHLGTTFLNQGMDQYNYLYSPTHVRAVAYLTGMIAGYFVYETRTKPLKLTSFQVGSLWLFSLGIMLGIVVGHTPMISAPEYNVLDSSFFNSLTRVGWSVALSIIIILCVNDYGGVINAFLSHEVFTVLIRLNYSVYLLHINVLSTLVAQGRTPTYFSNLIGFHQFWGDYCFTLAVSFVWTMAFESPILTIEKLIFARKPKSKNFKTGKESVVVEIRNNLNNDDPKTDKNVDA